MDAKVRRTLRTLARTRSAAEMKALFAAIRASDDGKLLALTSAPVLARSAGGATFAQTVVARLAVILAPAAEKAELLVDAFAETHGATPVRPAGLLPTVRKLAARHGEAAVATAADALLARAAAWGSTRERVT